MSIAEGTPLECRDTTAQPFRPVSSCFDADHSRRTMRMKRTTDNASMHHRHHPASRVRASNPVSPSVSDSDDAQWNFFLRHHEFRHLPDLGRAGGGLPGSAHAWSGPWPEQSSRQGGSAEGSRERWGTGRSFRNSVTGTDRHTKARSGICTS